MILSWHVGAERLAMTAAGRLKKQNGPKVGPVAWEDCSLKPTFGICHLCCSSDVGSPLLFAGFTSGQEKQTSEVVFNCCSDSVILWACHEQNHTSFWEMYRNVLITCEGQMWFGAAVQSGLAWFGPVVLMGGPAWCTNLHRRNPPSINSPHTVWFYPQIGYPVPSILILYTSHGKSWQVYTRNDDQRLDCLRIHWWANPYLPVFRMCLLGHSSQHNKHLLSPCFSPTSDRCWHRRR